MAEITTARKNRAPGRIVRVPLGEHRWAYGRVLAGVMVEFYDRAVETDGELDLLDLVTSPVAFRCCVMDSAFRRGSRWELLDVVALSPVEAQATWRSARRDALSGAFFVRWEHPASGTWGEVPATRDEIEGLEIAAVWEPDHVTDRLVDHFAGRPSRWVEALRRGC